MKYFVLVVITLCMTSGKCLSQTFDSVHVYAVSLGTMYYIKIDRELIKHEAEPIVLIDNQTMDAVHAVLVDTIKGSRMKKLKSNAIDIRLTFEFFKKDKVVQTIGVTNYNTMFVDYILYTCDKQNLKYLDRYIPGLSKTLGNVSH